MISNTGIEGTGGVSRAWLVVALGLSAIASIAYARDGDLDRSFGVNGKSFPVYPSARFIDAESAELALQADGKLLLVSSQRFSVADYDFCLMRLMPNGAIDTNFGASGLASFAFDRAGSDFGDHVYGVALQPNGGIVLAGYANGDPSTGSDMAVVRILANGTADPGFGTNGATIVPFNLGDCPNGRCQDQALGVSLQNDGKILVAGIATNDTGSLPAVVRLTASGQRDTSFDVDGRLTPQFGTGNNAAFFRARQLADHVHVLAVGTSNLVANSTNQEFVAVRLNDDGTPDTSFGTGGKLSYGFDVGGDLVDYATDFVELADGKLLLCGEVKVNNPGNFDFGCMRFLANGVPDPAFSPILIPFDIGGNFNDAPLHVQQDAQGRFILTGFSAVATNNFDFAVARLTSAGALDSSFGSGGIRHIDSLPGSGAAERSNQSNGLAIQPDGKIVILGATEINASGDENFEIVRLIGDTILSSAFELAN